MTGAEAKGSFEDAEFPVDCGGLRLLILAVGLVPPNVSGAEIRSSRFPQSWPEVQFEAGEHVVEATLAVLSIVSYDQIEQLIERCPFNSYATECASRDLSETLSQEPLAILRAH